MRGPAVFLLVSLAVSACTGGPGPDREPGGGAAAGFRAESVGATAGAVLEGRTFTWTGGQCTVGKERSSVEVRIGEEGGGDAFLLILGGEEGAPALEGGETYFIFTLRGEKEGASFAIGEGTLTLGMGLREGTFSGEDPSAGPVGGTFVC